MHEMSLRTLLTIIIVISVRNFFDFAEDMRLTEEDPAVGLGD